ncbi:hypothetical protein Y1Q_0013165 [Alligator mississippiensis]|uniref:MHC class I-like antigen recognition-like domain-containing protein n=1 Tax=Alligator mississippiensis TaxID=8496 RepID=A0A151MYR4_ALLMI|nr:hypothetical protein Y1Q_0013165 [Alligator mississippiensis]
MAMSSTKTTALEATCGLATRGEDSISYDPGTCIWVAETTQAQITQRRWNEDKAALQDARYYLEETCTARLRKYLQHGEEALQSSECWCHHPGQHGNAHSILLCPGCPALLWDTMPLSLPLPGLLVGQSPRGVCDLATCLRTRDQLMSHGTGERQAISGWTHHPVLPGPQLLPQERQATEHGAARYEAAPAQEAVEREAFKAAEKEAVESEASDAMEREALESEALASKASASSGSFG